MKSRIGFAMFTIMATCLLAGAAGTARAAEPPQEKPQAGAMSGGEMEAMMKAATPGEQHKQLARLLGDWAYTQKMWMAPGQPPAEASGTMHADSLFGGRYVEHHWKGNVMGMAFEGRGTEAYDNVTKQWVNTWVDNMGTGIMMSTGSCDADGKKCTYAGDMTDPMTGGKSSTRMVITWVDADTFTNEMYGKGPSGDEMKMMEITAKRKK